MCAEVAVLLLLQVAHAVRHAMRTYRIRRSLSRNEMRSVTLSVGKITSVNVGHFLLRVGTLYIQTVRYCFSKPVRPSVCLSVTLWYCI